MEEVVFILFLLVSSPTCLSQRPVLITTTPPESAAIVHGEVVMDPTKWPWQVFIVLNHGQDQCGGVLITDRWILTAGHCFDNGREPTRLVLGTTEKSGIHPNAVIAKVTHRCCHPDYDPLTLDNDICLLKADRSFNFPIEPVDLPGLGTQIENGKLCTVTGWGYDENRNLPEELQEAEVKIIDMEKCVEWHTSNRIVVVNNSICAGHESGGADTCGGDSGGPLVCREAGRFKLRGITSYGPSFCGRAKAPGIYTKVAKFIDWIEKTVEQPCPQYQWGEWRSECAVTCGRGIEKRFRTCFDEDNKETDTKNCNGGSEGIGYCHLSPCPKYNWSTWIAGECSATCGPGIRRDKRICLDENNATVSDSSCGDPAERTKDCTLTKCPSYHWSEWKTTCSVTCGSGIENSVRTCLDNENKAAPADQCPGPSDKSGQCNLNTCPVFAWTPWMGSCSVTCGTGLVNRTRNCVDEKQNKVEDSLCGAGTSQRISSCKCQKCRLAVYAWGDWNEVCGVSCGNGALTRTRRCYDDTGSVVSNDNCRGRAFEFDTCRSTPCPAPTYSWGDWAPWSECQFTFSSNPCDAYQYSTRKCYYDGREVQAEYCSAPVQNYRQSICSSCENPAVIFNFDEWRRNLFGGQQ